MQGPIFVVTSDGDVLAFSSPAEACSWVESIDVEEGEYAAAYDAEGRRLTLRVPTPTKQGRTLGLAWVEPGQVILEPLEEGPAHQEDLRLLLLTALQRRAEGPIDPHLPLATAVEQASQQLGPSAKGKRSR